MKVHHYDQMMAYLTRRRFANGGGAILPKPNPLSPEERNQKVFNDYVGRMKHYLTGAEMPEWFVKDLITKKAEELGIELKADGGRLKAAGPLLLAPYLLPYAAAFVGTAATGLMAQKQIQTYFENNPDAMPKFKEWVSGLGASPKEELTSDVALETEEVPTNWSQSFADDKKPKPLEFIPGVHRPLTPEEEQARAKLGSIPPSPIPEPTKPEHTGTPIPVIKPWEKPVAPKPIELPTHTGTPIPEQKGWQEFILYNKAIEKKIKDNAPEHKEQASDEYLDAVRELVDFHDGSVAKAMKISGLNREYVRAKFSQRGQKLEGTGGQITETIEPLEITKIFKDYTNDINKDSSIIDTIYNEALETGRIKKEDKYLNIKDTANAIGMDISTKGSKNQLLDLLMENVRKTDEGRSLAKKYHIDDVVNKVKEWSSDKQIVGGEPSTSKRYKFEQTKDAPLSKELTTIKTRIADLTKAEGTYDKDLEQIEHAGHLESLRTEERYQDLFKNLNTIQDMIFQDGFVNKDIIQNKGHAGDMESIYKELDALRGQKNINKELIKIQEKIDARLKKTQKQIRDHKEYTIGKNQDKRIARIKINLPKKGETFTGNNIVADLSKVDKRWIMGNVDLINSKATKFDDLNDNQKEMYRANLNDQYLKMIGKIYKEVGYGKGEIEDIQETISEGTHSKKGVLEKAQGGPIYGRYANQIKKLKIS